jgi:ASPIC and UnbV/FG-GAP-like repeat
MPLKNALSPKNAKELISISLTLAVIPALVFGTAKWAFYHFELGMNQTAFYYFKSTINDFLFLAIFLFVLLILTCVNLIATRLHGDQANRRRFTSGAVVILLLGLLLMTGYRLNKALWYPDSSSLQGICYNGLVILVYLLIGLTLHKQLRRLNALLGFLLAGLLVIPLSVFSYYTHSLQPVIFTDVAEEVGLKEMDNSLGLAWGDFNNDGWLDVYVSNHLPAATESLLYENRKGVFSAPRSMAKGDLHGAAWGDFDNDGALDLFVAGGNDTPIGPAYANLLFRNEGSTFRDVAASTGVDEPEGRAWGGTWADFNNDGFLDLFVVNYFSSNDLFMNVGGTTFRNVAKTSGISTTEPGEVNVVGTLCASWADFDGDGDMDIVTAGIQSGIALYKNSGNGTFADIAGKDSGLITNIDLGTENDPRGMTACAWGDYDNDGDLDLFIGSLSDRPGKNLLFKNQGNGTFIEVAAAAGVNSSIYSRAAMWGDFDNDGDLDLYVINEASDAANAEAQDTRGNNDLFMNQGDGTFRAADADATGVAGFPFVHEGTGALADFDNDGFIDIFIDNQRPPDDRLYYLRRNLLLKNAGNSNNWLKIRLRGTVSNRDGIGAKILLTTSGQQQFREQGGESHTFAQNSAIAHFGLGSQTAVDRIFVKWPSGITQTLTDVAPNQTLTIVEPDAR